MAKRLAKHEITAYPVFMDYEITIEEAVKRGRYDWTNSNITSDNFPTKQIGKAKLEVELVRFRRRISTKEALEEFDLMGRRPAEPKELLALGAQYPNLQRKFPIVELGFIWRCFIWRSRGYRYVLCLSRMGLRRNLSLCEVGRGWNVIWRFATVRK